MTEFPRVCSHCKPNAASGHASDCEGPAEEVNNQPRSCVWFSLFVAVLWLAWSLPPFCCDLRLQKLKCGQFTASTWSNRLRGTACAVMHVVCWGYNMYHGSQKKCRCASCQTLWSDRSSYLTRTHTDQLTNSETDRSPMSLHTQA